MRAHARSDPSCTVLSFEKEPPVVQSLAHTVGHQSAGESNPRGGQMNDELPQFSGHPVIDRHGTEVGTITDVVYDEMTEEPTWGVVSPGLLHSRHYIPLSPPVYLSDDGVVVV